MAEGQNKESESGVLGRLAGRGEEAVTRLMDELGRNPRVTDALGRAMSAKGKVDETTRKTLAQVGLAAADEIRDLRDQLERLEKRLAKLEGAQTTPESGTQSRTPPTSTKSSGGTPERSRSSSGGSSSGASSRRSSSGSSRSGSADSGSAGS